jgi:hypothetical protein
MFSEQKFSLRKSHFESLENIQSNAAILPEDFQENDVKNLFFHVGQRRWAACIKSKGEYCHADNTHHFLVTTGIYTKSVRLSVNACSLAGLNPSVVQIALVAREAFDENLSRFCSTSDGVLLKTILHPFVTNMNEPTWLSCTQRYEASQSAAWLYAEHIVWELFLFEFSPQARSCAISFNAKSTKRGSSLVCEHAHTL